MDCHCDKLDEAIKSGVKQLKGRMPRAPGFIIGDYILEMQGGYWVECENCVDKVEQ